MAHEIDTTTGRPAVFVTGEPAWHRLGTVIDAAATSRQAIQLAGLDWTVEQWPVEAVDPQTGANRPAQRHRANVRTDTHAVLGIVGQQYTPFQNVEAFDFMDAIVGDKLAMFQTAGALKEGRTVWMLARIPREYRAGPEDLIKPYVLLVNSHDGSGSLRMIPTTVRVVCNNTLNLALRHASGGRGEGIRIRHRPNLDQRVAEARQRLGVVAARFDRFDQELHELIAGTLKPRKVEAYFEQVLPPLPKDASDRQKQNRRDTLKAFQTNFEAEAEALPGSGVRHTPWAAYNAVSRWADHQRTFRGHGDQQRAENRLNSVWFGSSHHLKQKAYHAALELALAN